MKLCESEFRCPMLWKQIGTRRTCLIGDSNIMRYTKTNAMSDIHPAVTGKGINVGLAGRATDAALSGFQGKGASILLHIAVNEGIPEQKSQKKPLWHYLHCVRPQ